jgi:hypothetical protein
MSREMATDVRLIVRETLLRRLFERVLAALPAVQIRGDQAGHH